MPILHDEKLSLERYLTLTDAHFLVDFDALVQHEDATVRALVRALRHRIPLRAISSREGVEALDTELQARREQADSHGLDPECAVWLDRAADVPYHPYSPDEGKKGLRVRLEDGELADITALSPTIAALARPVVTHRLYWLDERHLGRR